MPTYEYACSSCQHEWEIEQSIKDDAITECPSCHAAAAKRQISRGGGFILKGSGWYADLYSSASNKKDESKKTEDKASPAASSSDGASGSTSPASSDGGSGKSESTASSESSASSSGSSSGTGTGTGKGSAAPV